MLKTINPTAKYYGVVVILTLLCGLLYWLPFDSLLSYRRSAISNGQLWRLISGNLLHTNDWHLLLNLAGLWGISLLHQEHYHAGNFSLLLLIFCLLQGIGLYYGCPSLSEYVGLSGMLHGLFTYGALKDIEQGRKSGYLLLAGVALKVFHEQIYGAPAQISALINAPVAINAHVVGLVIGILVFGGYRLSFKMIK